MNLARLQAVLEDYGKEIADNYRDLIRDRGHNASGQLIESISTYVRVDGRYYEARMKLADWWKYLEEGTKPHWPPIDAIAKWIEVKPVIPRPDASGRIPTTHQLAYLIARKISRVGTPATHLLRDTKEVVTPFWRSRISEALGHDMTDYIRKVVQSPA